MTPGQRFFRGSPCSSSSLLFFSSFLFLAANGPTTTAGPVQCNDAAGNYTANGTFQANLGRLLASLSANTSATGYFNDTEGRAPDQLVFGHATCRGDLSEAACRDCVTKAAGDTLRYCPNRRAVTAWYDDTCLLRYAGESFFGSPTGLQYVVFLTARVSDQQFAAYNQVLGGLMDRVAADAVRSPRKFAVGEANFTSFGKLYGMAQCTRDLGADGCDSCLRGEISTIPNNQRNGTRGCTVLGASCVIRFNENRFYSATTAADPSPPPPPPPLQAPPSGNPPEVPDTPSSNKKTTSKIALAVAIPLLAAALVIACLSSFTLCWRKKRKANSHAITVHNFLIGERMSDEMYQEFDDEASYQQRQCQQDSGNVRSSATGLLGMEDAIDMAVTRDRIRDEIAFHHRIP